MTLSRRHFLAAGGAIIVRFSLSPPALAADIPPRGLDHKPLLESWIGIGRDGRVTLYSGNVEIGQGIKTAQVQIAAEELSVPPELISFFSADTLRSPNEITAGSQSVHSGGNSIRLAAAHLRALLIEQAADKWGVSPASLFTDNGFVVSADNSRLAYADLVEGLSLDVPVSTDIPLKSPGAYRIVGTSHPRIDLPGKVTGAPSFVHDLKRPGMVHARIVRPPSYGAELKSVDTDPCEALPGVIKVIVDGSFLAVAAEREDQAIAAMYTLEGAAQWSPDATMPAAGWTLSDHLTDPSEDSIVLDRTMPHAPVQDWVEATYHRPFQMHGSMGPACAVAEFQDGRLTVWTPSQAIYFQRATLADLLGLPPDDIRCVHMEGPGCYGHNGAEDAAADAALIARALPGRPVRVQWTRQQEHSWEPYGSAMIGKTRAGLDADGRIVDWSYEVWSGAHHTRPIGRAGAFVPAWHLKKPFERMPGVKIPMPQGGGDRNSIPLYDFPRARVDYHMIKTLPVRTSSLRALGGYLNIFALESFMDELALKTQVDPVQFRLAHLTDERAKSVIEATARDFGWSKPLPKGRGKGFAFAQYKNLAGYCAIAMEIEPDPSGGRIRIRRINATVDAGQAINPDGIQNQVEGGILQSLSWTLFESVTFDETGILTKDWADYPIMRFSDMPDEMTVKVIDRPGEECLGVGEIAQGPTAAALANAIADATGRRLRDIPFLTV